MRIQPGRYVALVGASGAGKSTVLSLLQRFYDPAAGSVRIDGQDLRTLTQRSMREQIGVVTQDTFLFHDTIYNNILYGRLDATQEEVYEAARQAYAHDFILALPEGYETRVGDKGCRLSGGPAAASGHRAGVAQERAHSAAGRGDQRAGQRERTHDPDRAGNTG